MKSLLSQLRSSFEAALEEAFGEAGRGVDPLVKAAADAKFGDYQSNVAMGLAKKLGAKPRDVAQKIVAALTAVSLDLIDPPEIAGPGFINLRLKSGALQELLKSIPAEPPLPARSASEGVTTASAPDPTLSTAPGFDRLGIAPVGHAERQTVVIDFSSPNVAKQMHVGHLRSTIIGDTLARVIEFQGHEVIRQNHVGDWGTQFGIILEELYERGTLGRDWDGELESTGGLPSDPDQLETIYRAGNAKMSDAGFAERARAAVARLQAMKSPEMMAWAHVKAASMGGILRLYTRLNVTLKEDSTYGEQFYNMLLAGVIGELRAALQPCEAAGEQSRDRQGAVADAGGVGAKPLPHGRGSVRGAASPRGIRAVCREDQGAVCVFLENPDGTPAFRGPQGDPLPMIVQKSDGAFLYATTDLAAIAYRVNDFSKRPLRLHTSVLRRALEFRHSIAGVDWPSLTPPSDSQRGSGDPGGLGADRILYVVGSPQKLHFEMLFATARALGWTRPGNRQTEVDLQHVPFGSVLGEDRKMLRTRTGESVKLKDLLDEAVNRAEQLVRQSEADSDKRRGFSEDEIKNIAETVGIAAVKYADLCQNRNTDYVFSWDKMLALQGNTAPYMLYAYARIRSIYRRGGGEHSALSNQQSAITLAETAERALALGILRLPETIDAVAEALLPNILCEYLYDLAGRFMTFYEACPVLQAPDDATRASRLRLCDLTARALRLGLALLGIRTLDRM